MNRQAMMQNQDSKEDKKEASDTLQSQTNGTYTFDSVDDYVRDWGACGNLVRWISMNTVVSVWV